MEVNRKWYPKVSKYREKVFFENIVLEWPNSTVTKNPVLEVLSATLGHCYSQYYRGVT